MRLLIAASLLLVATTSGAQSWPQKPIRLIAASGPGGATDLIARIYGPRLADSLGQPIVVDDRPGTGGLIAVDVVSKAAPDGYTLLAAPGGIIVVGPYLYKNSNLSQEVLPVSPVSRASMFLIVRNDLPIKDVSALVSFARANPGKLNFSSSGSGSTPHLAGVILMRAAGFEAVHVPYKAAIQGANELLSGRIDFVFDNGAFVPQVKAGKVRLLAVARSTRSQFFPQTPTLLETGFDVDLSATTMTGLYAPPSMPKDIVARLNRDLSQILRLEEVRSAFAKIGAESTTGSPEEFAAEIRKARESLGGAIREANIKAD